MILTFPNVDALSLAISAGLIPAEFATKPVKVSQSDSVIAVDLKWRATKKQKSELVAVGIGEQTKHFDNARNIDTLFQLIPIRPDRQPPILTAQSAVLFRLPDPSRLTDIVTEMIRLGNDRQSFRWLEDESGHSVALLRVINPPYYTLLRVLDRMDGDSVQGFIERSPRVWVPVGFDHPFASSIRPVDGQCLIITAENDWQTIADEPFRDIYELLTFPLPNEPTVWQDAGPSQPISIPVRLAPGDAASSAEFWVLPESGFEAIDTFVRDADERLIKRLRFAVGQSGDGPAHIVIRVAPSKQPPPTLSIASAIGYQPYWKLPNLFLPVGTRLQPPLRRETVRSLLADDPNRCTWLDPDGEIGFLPRSLSESAFRPLEDWVQYVIERHREPIAEWIAASTFDFDSYMIGDGAPKPPKDKKPKEKSGQGGGQTTGQTGGTTERPESDKEPKPPTGEPGIINITIPKPPVRTPTEWEIRRQELEKEFLKEGTEPLDTPSRKTLWASLAESYANSDCKEDAAISYLQAIHAEPDRLVELASAWAQSEWNSTTVPVKKLAGPFPIEPSSHELRQVASLALATIRIPEFSPHRQAVMAFLDAHESRLPIRAIWLIHRELAKQTGSDVLGLTRCRDRIFARLYESGLNTEYDMARFLRYAGLGESERGRVVREKAITLYSTVRAWAEKGLTPATPGSKGDKRNTLAFIDLAFAFAFARLQDSEKRQELIDKSNRQLAEPLPENASETVQLFQKESVPLIVSGYQSRIDLARDGQVDNGPMKAELRVALGGSKAETATTPPASPVTANILNPHEFCLFCVVSYFEHSRIIDPQERKDPFEVHIRYPNEVKAFLRKFSGILDPDELAKAVRSALKPLKGRPDKRGDLFLILHRAIPLSGRVSESFALELLDIVPEAIAVDLPTPENAEQQGQLFERAIHIAVHFGRRERVSQLLAQFLTLFRRSSDDRKLTLLNFFGVMSLLAIRKLGLRDELERFLTDVQADLFKGLPLERARSAYASRGPKVWVEFLRTTLTLAAGWQCCERDRDTDAIFALTERELTHPPANLAWLDYSKLLQSTIQAAGACPPERGLSLIEQLFTAINPAKVQSQFSTGPYFSRLHIVIAEAVCLAITSDISAGSLTGRRWRDEEEFLIRNRINEELRAMVA